MSDDNSLDDELINKSQFGSLFLNHESIDKSSKSDRKNSEKSTSSVWSSDQNEFIKYERKETTRIKNRKTNNYKEDSKYLKSEKDGISETTKNTFEFPTLENSFLNKSDNIYTMLKYDKQKQRYRKQIDLLKTR